MDGKDAIKILSAVEKIPPEGGSILVTKLPDGTISTRPTSGREKPAESHWENFKRKLDNWNI
jgi:hypothetical protein